jgi:hypothetical protein
MPSANATLVKATRSARNAPDEADTAVVTIGRAESARDVTDRPPAEDGGEDDQAIDEEGPIRGSARDSSTRLSPVAVARLRAERLVLPQVAPRVCTPDPAASTCPSLVIKVASNVIKVGSNGNTAAPAPHPLVQNATASSQSGTWSWTSANCARAGRNEGRRKGRLLRALTVSPDARPGGKPQSGPMAAPLHGQRPCLWAVSHIEKTPRSTTWEPVSTHRTLDIRVTPELRSQ